jgi:FKBP-type peptidyl-prolyl cis-trans isomerase
MIRKILPTAIALGLAAISHAQEGGAGQATETPATGTGPAAAEEGAPEKPAEIAAIRSDASYGIGFQNGSQLRQFGLASEDIDTHTFLKGLLDALKGQDPEVNQEQLQAAMNSLGQLLQTREKELGETNLAAGRKFLEENAKREGVVTTKSGLQYEIIEKGGDEIYQEPKEGEAPDKQFLVNYRGTLIDGTEFDASAPGQPTPMTLSVIEGFKEALTMMPVGAKWKLYIPSELAYGAERRGGDIAPNSVLIFDLELVKIEDAPAAPHGAFPFPTPGGEE